MQEDVSKAPSKMKMFQNTFIAVHSANINLFCATAALEKYCKTGSFQGAQVFHQPLFCATFVKT